jgi:hypothetical protein
MVETVFKPVCSRISYIFSCPDSPRTTYLITAVLLKTFQINPGNPSGDSHDPPRFPTLSARTTATAKYNMRCPLALANTTMLINVQSVLLRLLLKRYYSVQLDLLEYYQPLHSNGSQHYVIWVYLV